MYFTIHPCSKDHCSQSVFTTAPEPHPKQAPHTAQYGASPSNCNKDILIKNKKLIKNAIHNLGYAVIILLSHV
jgi:hypothetical protein